MFEDRTEIHKVRSWRQEGGGLKCVVRGKADEKVREPDVMIDIVYRPRMVGPGRRCLSSRNSSSKKQALGRTSRYNTPLAISQSVLVT